MRRLLGRRHRRAGSGGEPRRGAAADALIVGLGNPGVEFRGTRHNLGADAVAMIASRHGVRLRADRRLRAAVGEVRLQGRLVALAVPTTYVNESGVAVRALTRRFGIEDLRRLAVVHDELDLPPGTVRVKVGGGTAGHNGLNSVRQHLGDAGFARVRVGIGKPPGSLSGADFVLRRPSRSERECLDAALAQAADAAETIVVQGVEAAMNRHNAGRSTS